MLCNCKVINWDLEVRNAAVVSKNSILDFKTFRMAMLLLALSTYQICIAGKQTQQLTLQCLFKSDKKSTDTLLNERQWLVSERSRLVFRKKITSLSNFGNVCPYSLQCNDNFQECYHGTMFSRQNFLDRDHDCRMRGKSLKKQAVHRDCSYTNALLDNFAWSIFWSEEPNTKLDSRVPFF